MTKIIAPLYQHDILSKDLLQNKEILLDTSILPLQSYINDIIPSFEETYDTQVRERLTNLQDELILLKDYIKNDSFIASLKDFHSDMHLYNIKIEDLKDDSVKDKELKRIFQELESLIPDDIKKLHLLKDALSNQDVNDTYITQFPIRKNSEQEMVNILKEAGLLDYPSSNIKPSSIKVYYANNMRSEVEASAQYIVENNLLNTQVIVLDEAYKDLIKQVYNRYNIVSNLSDIDDNSLSFKIKFINVIKVLSHGNKEDFKHFLSSNPFDVEAHKDICILNDFFNWDIESFLNYTPVELNDSIIHQASLDTYNKHTEKALPSILYLQETLRSFTRFDNLLLIEDVFNTLLTIYGSSSMSSIYQSLLKQQDRLKTSETLIFDLESILLKSNRALISSDGVVVTDLSTHHHFNKDSVIILGATLKNYPQLQTLSGIIDESYVKDLSYPSKTDRLSKQIKDLDALKQGEHIVIFYPLSSFAGKAVEPSFSLLSFANKYGVKPLRYPLIENDNFTVKTYTLRPDLAQQLFFKGDLLTGSISSFEQYNNCPYAYYLQRGLKLYPESLPDLSYAYLGSVTHAIIEAIIQKRIDVDQTVTHNDVEYIINENFKSLELLNDSKVDVVKITLIKHFKKILNHMNEIDEDTLFKPILLEQSFRYKVSENILVSGFIDRVDKYNDYVRVIDYKSSNHKLSATSLKQGLQLQLVTYLLAISLDLDLKPAGAFYMMLKSENASLSPISVKKSSPYLIEHNDADYEAQALKMNRIEGWHFEDGDQFYKSSDYVASLSMKDEVIKTRTIYNIDTVETVVTEVYTNIYDNLKQGNIDCLPIDNPCQFCPYHSICLSSSTKNYKAQIYPDQKLNEEVKKNVD